MVIKHNSFNLATAKTGLFALLYVEIKIFIFTGLSHVCTLARSTVNILIVEAEGYLIACLFQSCNDIAYNKFLLKIHMAHMAIAKT